MFSFYNGYKWGCVMKNYKVIISYNGVNFNGYQKQDKLRSVQGEIEKTLYKIHGYEVKSFGSGRTDKGVHAYGQVFNFESVLNMSCEQFKKAFNALLPDDIYVKSVEEVEMSFHSRYSCLNKEYHYVINLGEYNPLEKDLVFQFNREINVEKMIQASNLFVGEHDFKNFCACEEDKVKDYIRNIEYIEILKEGDKLIFKFRGNGFLRYMVRMLVGVLLEIGKGRKDELFVKERLDCNILKRSNYKVSACGLYLVKVNY